MSEQIKNVQTFDSPALVVVFAKEGGIKVRRDGAQIGRMHAAWCLLMVAKRMARHG